MTKAVKSFERSKGIAYGVLGITGSISVLLSDTLGAYLFRKEDRLPFMLPLSVFCV